MKPKLWPSFVLLFSCVSLAPLALDAAENEVDEDAPERPLVSDARAVEIAEAVMEKMGGREAWERTRFLSWKFFGRRMHYWDRHTGDVRIEGTTQEGDFLWLMNVDRMDGRVWKGGQEITDPDELAEALVTGRKIWVNDSYWLVMPYKLLDPGVVLQYRGVWKMKDGRRADVLDMTFHDGVGYTPENRYEIYVAKDTGLVEQWTFYSDRDAEEPVFTLPWTNWQKYGEIMLSNGRGRGPEWPVAVHDELSPSVFRSPSSIPE